MSPARLVALAESCSSVRASIGKMLLAPEESQARSDATEKYRSALKALLRLAREEEYGIYLEIAGELATKD